VETPGEASSFEFVAADFADWPPVLLEEDEL